jgi:tRNA G10  N-methylase Trm11
MSEPKNKKIINKELGPNSVDLGHRGLYDKRNRLNDLSGKEWVYFTNSVWITGYSPTAIENVGLKHRKIHPSPKPPGLIKDIIQFFTKADGKILDPFVGVGGTLLAAALAGDNRQAIGIDLNAEFKDAYLRVCKEERMKKMPFIIGDSKEILSNSSELQDQEFDLIIADPPYSDMMSRKRTGQKPKLYKTNEATPFTLSERDLGNMPLDVFLESLKEILILSIRYLKKDKYLVVFCKDFQPKGKIINILHADVVSKINEINNIEYKGMRIWHDQAMSLYPFGYPYSFIMNQIHQYILIFKKVI